MFKIGQTIELIKNKGMGADLGATAIVKHVNKAYVSVIWKRDEKWNNQEDGGYYPIDFKLISQKNQQLEFDFMIG